jgi:hypothetical protein
MSFSSEIKQELNKNSNLTNKKMVEYELMGYLISGNIDFIGKLAGYLITGNAGKNNKKIKFSTESDYNINRFSKLLANLNINHNIEINRKEFCNKIKDIRNRTNYEIQ